MRKRADWPLHEVTVGDKDYKRQLRFAARDYSATEQLIGQLLNAKNFHFLTDNDYTHFFPRYKNIVIIDQSVGWMNSLLRNAW